MLTPDYVLDFLYVSHKFYPIHFTLIYHCPSGFRRYQCFPAIIPSPSLSAPPTAIFDPAAILKFPEIHWIWSAWCRTVTFDPIRSVGPLGGTRPLTRFSILTSTTDNNLSNEISNPKAIRGSQWYGPNAFLGKRYDPKCLVSPFLPNSMLRFVSRGVRMVWKRSLSQYPRVSSDSVQFWTFEEFAAFEMYWNCLLNIDIHLFKSSIPVYCIFFAIWNIKKWSQ